MVTEQNGRVKGYIALSPISITDGSTGWYGLGPLAVASLFQGHGIGRGIMENALFRLRQSHARGCVVLGNPEFYCRFGFAINSDLNFQGVSARYFLSLTIDSLSAAGIVSDHPAFNL